MGHDLRTPLQALGSDGSSYFSHHITIYYPALSTYYLLLTTLYSLLTTYYSLLTTYYLLGARLLAPHHAPRAGRADYLP